MPGRIGFTADRLGAVEYSHMGSIIPIIYSCNHVWICENVERYGWFLEQLVTWSTSQVSFLGCSSLQGIFTVKIGNWIQGKMLIKIPWVELWVEHQNKAELLCFMANSSSQGLKNSGQIVIWSSVCRSLSQQNPWLNHVGGFHNCDAS